MTLEMAFNIVMGIAASGLGLLVKNLYAQIESNKIAIHKLSDDLKEQLTSIKVDYLPKSEAIRNMDLILDQLKEIKTKINRLDDKMSVQVQALIKGSNNE